MDNNLPGVCDLSVENVKEEPQYHIAWPNPNHTDQINIGFTLFEQDEIHIQVIDLTGRIHLQKRLETLEKGKNSMMHPFRIKAKEYRPNNRFVHSDNLVAKIR